MFLFINFRKDISLPKQLQKAFCLEAEATRLAKAKVVLAEGEKEASINLRKAAEMMSKLICLYSQQVCLFLEINETIAIRIAN